MEKKRLKRICNKCGKIFVPDGRGCKLCEPCYYKAHNWKYNK